MYKCFKIQTINPLTKTFLGERDDETKAKILILAHIIVDKATPISWEWSKVSNNLILKFCIDGSRGNLYSIEYDGPTSDKPPEINLVPTTKPPYEPPPSKQEPNSNVANILGELI